MTTPIRTNTSLSAPAQAYAATPSADPLPLRSRALYVGVAGNLTVIPQGQTDSVVFVNVQPGTILPIVCSHVLPATTAGSIVVLV